MDYFGQELADSHVISGILDSKASFRTFHQNQIGRSYYFEQSVVSGFTKSTTSKGVVSAIEWQVIVR